MKTYIFRKMFTDLYYMVDARGIPHTTGNIEMALVFPSDVYKEPSASEYLQEDVPCLRELIEKELSPMNESMRYKWNHIWGSKWLTEPEADEVSFETALQCVEYALQDNLEVVLEKNDDSGEMMWHVVVHDSEKYKDPFTSGFWMCSYLTKKEAVSVCDVMKWKIMK